MQTCQKWNNAKKAKGKQYNITKSRQANLIFNTIFNYKLQMALYRRSPQRAALAGAKTRDGERHTRIVNQEAKRKAGEPALKPELAKGSGAGAHMPAADALAYPRKGRRKRRQLNQLAQCRAHQEDREPRMTAKAKQQSPKEIGRTRPRPARKAAT